MPQTDIHRSREKKNMIEKGHSFAKRFSEEKQAEEILNIYKETNEMNVLKHTIKKFIYGTLPYYFMKGYKPGSPYLKYYEYIKEHGYSRHLYEFKDEYANMPVDVQKDEKKGLYYVQKEKEATLFQKKHSSQENSKNIIGL